MQNFILTTHFFTFLIANFNINHIFLQLFTRFSENIFCPECNKKSLVQVLELGNQYETNQNIFQILSAIE